MVLLQEHFEPVDLHPSIIERDADDLEVRRAQEGQGSPVGGRLDQDRIARLEQHLRDQGERLLGAGGDPSLARTWAIVLRRGR